MITNKILAHAALFFGLAASGLIFISFLIYAVKRQDYYKLVSSYTKKYTFPAPYSFYHMVGFFGAFPVIRFFIKSSQRKKFFLWTAMIRHIISLMIIKSKYIHG